MYPNGIYETQDAAAYAFGKIAIADTCKDYRERGAFIRSIKVKIKDPKGVTIDKKPAFTYDNIYKGRHNNVVFGFIIRYKLYFFRFRKISFTHTHPHCDCHRSDTFSKGFGDELVTKLPWIDKMYLISSKSGKLYVYDRDSEIHEKLIDLPLLPTGSIMPSITP